MSPAVRRRGAGGFARSACDEIYAIPQAARYPVGWGNRSSKVVWVLVHEEHRSAVDLPATVARGLRILEKKLRQHLAAHGRQRE
jgi:hypothetical protein